MRMNLITDPAEHRDAALTAELRDWLHSRARGGWTVCETAADGGLIVQEYCFEHPLDAFAVCFRKCRSHRARRA
jgi:hypothetical protein